MSDKDVDEFLSQMGYDGNGKGAADDDKSAGGNATGAEVYDVNSGGSETVSSSLGPPAKTNNKKRKIEQDSEGSKKAKVPENRAIFISNLPRDTNVDEIAEEFKKYGIIDVGVDGTNRIKMYTDDEGNFNGEALVVYFKKESVDLAIRLMDDYWFRPGEEKYGKISVKEADMSFKRHNDGDKVVSKLSRKDRKNAERVRAELHRKLAEWSDNEEEVAAAYAPKKNKWAKIVVLKHAFTLDELEEDTAAYLDIKEDIRGEAGKHGDVTNVTLYEKEEDGVVTIRFRDFEAAENFRAAADGRSFGKQKLVATLAEEKPRFRKAGRGFEEEDEESE